MMQTIQQRLNHINLPKWFLPLTLMVLGAILRLAYLGIVPGGIHQDEAFVALNARGLIKEGLDSGGNHLPVYMSSWGDGQSAMYIWLLAPLLVFCEGIPSLFIVRLPQVMVSILTLWAVYCLIHRMFHRRAALWSLFLLAICPWHIMMSRWGLDANLAPGFLIFGLYFFIRGLEEQHFLLASAFFYGCSLYCYAVIWPIVPLLLFFQIVYGLCHRKLSINKWSLLSTLILFLCALPLMLFVLVNSDILPQIALPFMTIPKMSGYRGGEVALSLSSMLENLRTALSLFVFQNTGSPYDVLLPWGLFYDIGRVFIVVGGLRLVYVVVRSFLKRQFAYEYYLFIPLLCGGISCLLVSTRLHQTNNIYIPLVLCEAYGVWSVLAFLGRKLPRAKAPCTGILTALYLLCLLLFQRDYYTDYRTLADAYFAAGIEESVTYALQQCEEQQLHTITVEKGAQWPRLLLYTETLPSQYFSSVVYDIAPAPASFDTGDIHVNTRINYDAISSESIYIIYYTDKALFEADYTLTPFHDWYVAVPK